MDLRQGCHLLIRTRSCNGAAADVIDLFKHDRLPFYHLHHHSSYHTFQLHSHGYDGHGVSVAKYYQVLCYCNLKLKAIETSLHHTHHLGQFSALIIGIECR